jgi:chromosome segregation ATPase
VWRAGIEHSVQRSEQRAAEVCASAEAAVDAARTEMAESASKCMAGVRELEQQWPEWLSELREAQTLTEARAKASSSSLADRLEAVEDRLDNMARGPTGALSGLAERIGRLEEGSDGSDASVRSALGKAEAELAEMRAAVRHQKQLMGTMMMDEKGRSASVASLDVRLRQVGAMAEEHARYLVALGDALHDKAVGAPKFRSSAIAFPSSVSVSAVTPSTHSQRAPPCTSHSLVDGATSGGMCGVGAEGGRDEELESLMAAGRHLDV